MTVQVIPHSVTELAETVSALEEHNDLLTEAIADLEMAAEDSGWRVASMELDRELSREGMTALIRNCTIMSIASPLIKRGLQLRIGYVWGQGFTIQARATSAEDGGQDVNAVLQAHIDNDMNQKSFWSAEAQEENERTLGTEGNLILTFFPDPLTGLVQIRTTPFVEIQDKICNPEDRDDVWFFYRQYSAVIIEAGYGGTTRRRKETRRVLHPALGFWPRVRPKVIDGLPVMWDQPILHVTVNKPKHSKWGIPDVYASLPWARAYEGFLTDWARLVKALSKFAWRLSGDKASKAKRAAAALAAAVPTSIEARGLRSALPGRDGQVGQAAASGPGITLEAIPKTGATIDSGSGRPLASLAAAGMGVSVVDLLADPGVTGARAVAETLDKPVILEMNGRRRLQASVMETAASYVIDQAVKAPRGPLKGTVIRDPQTDREVITLAGDVERTVQIAWPDLNELDPTKLIEAICSADSTQKLPPKVIARLLLEALGEDDIDEILEEMTDEDGNWIDPSASAGDEAVRRFRNGEDPADVLDPTDDPEA